MLHPLQRVRRESMGTLFFLKEKRKKKIKIYSKLRKKGF